MNVWIHPVPWGVARMARWRQAAELGCKYALSFWPILWPIVKLTPENAGFMKSRIQTVTAPGGVLDITKSRSVMKGANSLTAIGYDKSETTLVLPDGVDPAAVIGRLVLGGSVVVGADGSIKSIDQNAN